MLNISKLRNPTPLLLAILASAAGHPVQPIVPPAMSLSARNQRRLSKKR